jgi:hypothetical protein
MSMIQQILETHSIAIKNHMDWHVMGLHPCTWKQFAKTQASDFGMRTLSPILSHVSSIIVSCMRGGILTEMGWDL